MTDLLPNADKVQVNLEGESITVPTGVVWVVDVSADTEVILDYGTDTIVLCDDSSGYDSTVSITLHEGDTLTVNTGNKATVRGWEFDYST